MPYLSKTSLVSYMCNVIETTAIKTSKEQRSKNNCARMKNTLKYCHPEQTPGTQWAETIFAVIPEIIWLIGYDGISKHEHRVKFGES